MLKQISILATICFAALDAWAQTEKYTAPVRWERYKVSDKDVSLLFPKLPVLIRQTTDSCSQMESRQYAVYAEGVAYGFNITSRIEQKVPDYCENKRTFDEDRFKDKLNELKSRLQTDEATKINRNKLELIKVKGEILVYWLMNDFNNQRWFEIWTSEDDTRNLKVRNFVESVRIEKSSPGIEIGTGAPRTLGDEGVNLLEEKDISDSEKGESQNLKMVVKTHPSYTDAARQAQVKGVVKLKVAFLANGGIGNIELINDGLPFGLTEQAINIASKIIFIPPKKNGKFYTVTKLLEYSFSIY